MKLQLGKSNNFEAIFVLVKGNQKKNKIILKFCDQQKFKFKFFAYEL